ncbi:hypothetical protein [Brenneria uluponensis]|nr:hypothetical protein [Brenneria ulupoensis]
MTATNQFAAHVGLDWADKKHNVCAHEAISRGILARVLGESAVWMSGR